MLSAFRQNLKVLSVIIVSLTILAGAVHTTAFRRLEYLEFDWLTTLTSPGRHDERIVIVGIDEPSFAELDLQWPWPRGLHGKLVRELVRAGAAVIVFDVVFAEPSDPEQDRLLADSIRDTDNVVLAADIVLQETTQFSQVMRVEPYESFREAGATSAVAAVTLDEDQVVRRIPQDPDAMWRVVSEAYRTISDRNIPGPSGGMIRYLGPDHTFRYVSYYQALDPERFLPEDIFQDRIVFIGLDLKVSPEVGLTQGEMFATPHMGFTGWPMPGVEVQANLAANALSGAGINETPRIVVLAVIFLFATIAVLLMRRWRPLTSALAVAAILIGLAACSLLLFAIGDLWLPVSGSMTAVVLVYAIQGGAAFLHERRRKQQIRQAFGYYVSRDVVREVIANPEKLVLGGVRRELTIMFTDLVGFTSLSEKMSPEQVTELLNRYLASMSNIIMECGGTVDKFIGDAIMAFWGAPLDDPEQAKHACQAAKKMLHEMVRLREDLQSSGLPSVSMRMGLHSGHAVVGNMGSSNRFDYTAIGDNVNLASRLEEANKLYGTAILLSSTTVAQLEDNSSLRYVDRIRVAGKEQPIDIFTFCSDTELIGLSRRALDAYTARDWQHAQALWRKSLMHEPKDDIATVYLKRIEGFLSNPPGLDWDGITSLDKKF